MPKMYGPAFTAGGEIVEREVPEADVDAYRAAGYKLGPLPAEMQIEAEAEDAPLPEPKLDLHSLTKAELQKMASEQGMETTGMNKADIIELLSAS